MAHLPILAKLGWILGSACNIDVTATGDLGRCNPPVICNPSWPLVAGVAALVATVLALQFFLGLLFIRGKI